jgi:hypothetical protein
MLVNSRSRTPLVQAGAGVHDGTTAEYAAQ